MALLGFFIGALITTYFVSRLYLWLTKSWDGGATRLFIVHGASLLTAGFLGGLGMADGGAFAGGRAVAAYALPQAFWLAVDLVALRGRRRRATPLKP